MSSESFGARKTIIWFLCSVLGLAFLFSIRDSSPDWDVRESLRSEVIKAGVDSTKASILAGSVQKTVEALVKDPRYMALLDSVQAEGGGPDEVFAQAMGMSARGMARLPASTIDSIISLKRRLYNTVSDSVCGKMALGRISRDGIYRAYAQLDTTAMRTMAEMSVRAGLAELRELRRHAVSEEEINTAWDALIGVLTQNELRRMSKVFEASSPTPEDACWLERTVWYKLQRLDRSHRVTLTRQLQAQIPTPDSIR